MKAVRRKTVEARLALEAEKLNAAHRGFHQFKPIWPVDDPSCNWSTSFEMRGSTASFDDLRDAIARVQADMPLVKFE